MTSNKILKIGNSSGFWGDNPTATLHLATQQPDLDYIVLDYLAEVSLSIMAIQKEKDPALGYAKDFLSVVESLVPIWKQGSALKIVTNAGGLNPIACGEACLQILKKANLPLKIGVVFGDDLLPQCLKNPSHPLFRHLETETSMVTIKDQLVSANCYLGAEPIVNALKDHADIVITGRVADPSLAVGPAIYHFGWSHTDFHKTAGATVAGHLIECGTQATGGIFTDWLQVPDPAHMGFPFVEISEDGSFAITKPENTGGIVSLRTIKEQLLYEIGDPNNYLSPDVTASFLSLKLSEPKQNCVHVTGAMGKAPPATYKVSSTYRDGFRTEGSLAIFGPQAPLKARKCAEIILERMKIEGYPPERACVETLGAGSVVPGVFPINEDALECMLRIALADKNEKVLQFFAKSLASLVTCGPQGTTGYITGRPHVRPVFGYWPCLIEREKIKAQHKILS